MGDRARCDARAMINTLAIAGYRSLRDVIVELAPLTVITGPNGSGKSSLYRALRLLADVAQGRVIASLAAEGGLTSTLWAGPERFSRAMKTGEHPVQGTQRSEPIALKLGFASDDYGYAIDLGLPPPRSSSFANDPEIKAEALWTGAILGSRNVFAERHGNSARLRSADTGSWQTPAGLLSPLDSLMTHRADVRDGLELLALRERMRAWRFYDDLRTDRQAPSRGPGIGTFTPALAADGSDVGAAIQTIFAVGDGNALAATIADAFDGAVLGVGDRYEVEMRQHGLLRPLTTAELSDGTLRYILLAAALLSPRPPELIVLNEPEASLHPDLLAPLARLMVRASAHSQIIVVSHARLLVDTIADSPDTGVIRLEKTLGETIVQGTVRPAWVWPKR